MKVMREALSRLDRRKRRALRHHRAARKRRNRFGDKPVVAVTGSVGKTTAAHFLNHLLSAHREVVYRGGDGNTIEVAVSSLRRLRPHHEVALFEVGSRGPGTLRPILELVEPTIGITTTVSSDHFSAFRTLEATADEKAELARSLPADGMCLLNMDDERVRAMASQTKGRVVFFGLSADADYRAIDVADVGLQGVRFTVLHDGARTPFAVPVMGSHLVPTLLGPIACAHRLGLAMEEIASAASSFRSPNHRCSLHQLSSGIVIVSDVAKAPGGTVAKPFALLDRISAPRKTIVIGQISDYGSRKKRMYRRACREASEHADRVILFSGEGISVRPGVDTRPETKLHQVEDAKALAELIAADGIPGEVILLKSAGRLHLERVLLDDVKPVACWRSTCPAVHPCERCENLYDPECRAREKPPRPRKFGVPLAPLPGPPR